MGTHEEKKAKFEELMQDEFVLVHLDARDEKVIVPESLAGNPSLTLKMSYAFQGQILHDDEQITAYLKFAGVYVECVIPWSTVWGMTSSDQQQAIWPEDLPKEVMIDIARQQFSAIGKKLFGKKENENQEAAEEVSEPDEPDNRPQLKSVASNPEKDQGPLDPDEKKKKRGHLKVVK